MDKVESFRGARFFLSNFYPVDIEWNGMRFPSSEHAFVAAKCQNPADIALVQLCPTPGEAKRLGRKIQLRPDWDKVKVDVMRDILQVKFRVPELRAQLLATGDEPLVEHNWWGDRFWGMCDGVGENMLGKLLMELRTELR
jgi:ribA/ribD-fused uncharacterized protein